MHKMCTALTYDPEPSFLCWYIMVMKRENVFYVMIFFTSQFWQYICKFETDVTPKASVVLCNGKDVALIKHYVWCKRKLLFYELFFCWPVRSKWSPLGLFSRWVQYGKIDLVDLQWKSVSHHFFSQTTAPIVFNFFFR